MVSDNLIKIQITNQLSFSANSVLETGAKEKDSSDNDAKDKIETSDINNAREVLIGGDTEDNR